MRKIYLFAALLFSLISVAQVPQGISYQAIALNGSGNPVVNSNVGLRLSVLDNSASGTVLYTETHVKTTNAQGLFNTVIGQGTPTSGTFASINWGMNSKFLKVEMDAAGGTNYLLIGNTQLLSVPYAMYAGNTASITGSNASDELLQGKDSGFAYAANNGNVYAFNINTGTWVAQSGTIIAGTSVYGNDSNGSFAYAANNGNVYAFNRPTGTWIGQSGTIVSGVSIVGANGNFAYAANNGNVYAFNKNTATWIAQSGTIISGTEIAYTKDGSFAYASNNGNVYAFNARTGVWTGQSGTIISGQPIAASNGNFAYAANNGNVYTYRKSTGTWIAQSGTIISGTTISKSETN